MATAPPPRTSTASDLFAGGMILFGGVAVGKILVDQVLLAKEAPGRGKTEIMPAPRRSQAVADDLVAYGAFIFGVYLTLTQLPDLIAEWKKVAP